MILDSCDWNAPGAHRFTGHLPAAVERYTDIPVPIRKVLRERLERHQYDDVVAIRRDSIEGEHQYADLRMMHFGAADVCRRVSRTQWRDDALERGLVYCVQDHCVIVPSVCGNLSLITRLPDPKVVEIVPSPLLPPAAESDPVPEEGTVANDPPAPDSFAASAGTPPEAPYGLPPRWYPAWTPPPPVAQVPEPSVWVLMLAGLLAAVLRRRLLP